jgi:adenylosuccinate synthase
VVVDPWHLVGEIEKIVAQGVAISPEVLIVADNACLILPIHPALDVAREAAASAPGARIGTTGRGIGPAYEDKVGRRAIRVCDLASAEDLKVKIERLRAHHDPLRAGLGLEPIDPDALLQQLLEIAPKILPYVQPAWRVLDKARRDGKRVLFEGAQGAFLDVDHGTYPYVTSSNPTAGGAAVGSGIGPTRITRVIGILKAYTTRVGSGPFPTELHDAMGERLRKVGGEVGVTTGRPRRCGWFDAVIGRYAARVNGITDFFLTKLDVLSGLETVPVCVGYEVDGRRVDEMPMTQTDVHHAQPVYEELPGWFEDISACREFAELPANAQAYVKRIEELTGAPVSAIGVGPGRDETITRDV